MNYEHQIAVAFMTWWGYTCPRLGLDVRLLHAIPNAGGYKGGFASNARRVSAMKAEGVRAGVSDYFFAVPRGTFHGLYLELKSGGPGIPRGTVSKEQKEFGAAVTLTGYRFAVAFGTEEAIKAIQDYLSLSAPHPFPVIAFVPPPPRPIP